MSKLIKQIDAALTSPDDSDAVRLWLWIKITNGGEVDVADLLASPLPNAVAAANVLHANGRLRIKETRVIARPFETAQEAPRSPLDGLEGLARYRAALDTPRAHGAAKAIREAEAWVFKAYNVERTKRKVRNLPDDYAAKHARYWREAARFALGSEIKIAVLMAFAYERTRWQRTKFPTAALIGGQWLQDEWADKDAGTARDHAGHSYEKTDQDFAASLHGAGFDDLNEAMVRHVWRLAKVLRERPKLSSPHHDPNVEAAVQWAAKNWSESWG